MNIKILKYIFVVFILFIMTSCSTIPETTVSYYLPKIDVQITVTKTVSCRDESKPFVKTDVTFIPVYSADYNQQKKIDFSKFDRFYASSDASVTLTEDGRLSAFNSSSTGHGVDVVNTMLSVAPIIGVLSNQTDVTKACKIVNQLAGKTKGEQNLLSVVLTSLATFSKTASPPSKATPFKIQQYPQTVYSDIRAALGSLTFDGKVQRNLGKRVRTTQAIDKSLELIEPAIVTVSILDKSPLNKYESLFSTNVAVPQLGTDYYVPIPTPTLFGGTELGLELHESGKIKTLKYGKTNGVKDVGMMLSTLNDKFDAPTDAEKAAKIKAQADVIAQQQRFVICKTTPLLCK